MRLARDALLMKLGAAKTKTPAAWRLLEIEVAARGANFTYRLDRNKLIELARERESAKRRGDLDSVSLDEAVSDSDDAPTFSDGVDAASSGQLGEEVRIPDQGDRGFRSNVTDDSD
jgi:hypothetical protein